MATLNKFQIFVQDLAHAVHDLSVGGDTLRFSLTNTEPSVSLDALLADLPTPISYTNLSGQPTSLNITITASAHTTGTFALEASDQTLTASGGTVGPFQFLSIFNLDTVAKVDPLIGYYDYGSALTLNDGESLTIDFGANGAGNGNILTIT